MHQLHNLTVAKLNSIRFVILINAQCTDGEAVEYQPFFLIISKIFIAAGYAESLPSKTSKDLLADRDSLCYLDILQLTLNFWLHHFVE